MRRSQCLVALRSARGEEKGKSVLIARGQRNPITVGIDYKIVCVNDFHADSGRAKPAAKHEERLKLANWARLSNRREGNRNDKEAESKFK